MQLLVTETKALVLVGVDAVWNILPGNVTVWLEHLRIAPPDFQGPDLGPGSSPLKDFVQMKGCLYINRTNLILDQYHRFDLMFRQKH